MTRFCFVAFWLTAACHTAANTPPPATTTTTTTSTTTTVVTVPATAPPTPAVVEAPRARPRTAAAVGLGASSDTLACIRHVESRGRYNAVSASGKYHGAYQASHTAWGGYGGYAEADQAPPDVQDRWAAEALATRGIRAWGAKARRVCG